MPKISIIIPVYNVEKYLKNCLESVINQTLKDIEIICINDASTDSSLDILNEFAKYDNRIKVITYEQNKGQSYARNKGLDIAQGEYIGFIDSDDTISENYYEYLYNRAKDNNADISSGKMVYILSDNSHKIGNWLDFGEMNGRILTKKEEKIERVYKNCASSSAKNIYKNEFLKNNNIKFLTGHLHEDQLFNLIAYCKANKIVTERYDSPEYHYHVREGSSMQNNNSNSERYKKKYFDQITIINKMQDFIKKENADKKCIDNMNNYFKKIIEYQLETIDPKYIKELFKKIETLDLDKKTIKKIKLLKNIRILNIQKPIYKIKRDLTSMLIHLGNIIGRKIVSYE